MATFICAEQTFSVLTDWKTTRKMVKNFFVKRLENHEIFYIGSTELHLRFTYCAPLLGTRTSSEYIVAILPLWLEFPLLVRASNSKGLVFSSPKSRTIISWLSLICVSTSLSITLAGSWTSRRLRRRPHDSKLSRPLVHETWNNNDKCACNSVCMYVLVCLSYNLSRTRLLWSEPCCF